MITWMQKHNRYLVWTIWVATIAFIGAGFVGWGSYKYGSKASAVGKVGDIEISNAKLNLTYQNLYERYNEAFQGKFDEEQAKKMGLIKQAFDSLASQAQLLNLARQYGVVVSEKELADYIATMKGFQENGVFNKQVYNTYLQNRRLKSSTFESILSDELTIQKILGLLEHPALAFENKTVAAALSIEDKIGYKVLSPGDMNVVLSDEEVRQAWETNKEEYKTPQLYALSLLWTETKDISVTDKEIQEYYDKNSFNYVSADGSQLPLEKTKKIVTQDLRIKKGKKQALLDYIALKKGKITSTEEKKLPINDPLLTAELWQEIVQSNTGTLLKPKVAGTRYVTVKVVNIIAPEPLPFEQAKDAVSQQLKLARSAEMMEEQAKEMLEGIEKVTLATSDYVSLTQGAILAPLDQQESLQFLEKLFTSSGKKGIIRLSKSMVVYKMIDQRIRTVDENLTASVQNETDQIKKRVFEDALFKKLNEQFPVKAYAKGL
jgi:peptidyl-prolyl cis-trans isomerase D